MSSGDRTSSDIWVQTRRRIDVLFGISCFILCMFAAILLRYTSATLLWQIAGLLCLVGVLWLVIRRDIPREGRVYQKGRIQHEHKCMIAIAYITMPGIIAILTVEWLKPPYPEWIYIGILALILTLLLRTLGRLDRNYRTANSSKAAKPEQGEL